jgi:hypothetical protein
MNRTAAHIIFITLVFIHTAHAQPINRMELVKRHNVIVTSADTLSSLTVGNGKFAFTVDATGLQSFPDYYARGVPLGTESEWGWHSFPNTEGYKLASSLKTYQLNGKNVSYAVQWNEGYNKKVSDWFRQNPHRLQLANIGFQLLNEKGERVTVHEIKNIHQELNLWKGEVHSQFSIDGLVTEVITCCAPNEDAIAVKVASPLLQKRRLSIFIRFSYPTGEWADVGNNFVDEKNDITRLLRKNGGASIQRQLDSTQYWVDIAWNGNASISENGKNYFLVTPNSSDNFEFVAGFSQQYQATSSTPFRTIESSSTIAWQRFWQTGGAIDFSGTNDPRAFELERRIVLSQYLMRVQEAGSYPPQETGLTYNSWFGKPHLEMHWWHAAHYAFWGRVDLLEKSLDWYAKVFQQAKSIAMRQGYQGVRWQKMTDNAGEESPSSVGAFLIWQQPHLIYFAELCYRQHKDVTTLNKYKALVFATAEFMSSYAYLDQQRNRYILGRGVIPAQERYKPEETFNPTFELAYWSYALSVAQQWRERLKMPREKKWDDVLKKISALPESNGVYLAAESAKDTYTKPEYKTDHPSMLAAYGFLPKTKLMDTAVMHRTFDLIWKEWNWERTWGWDFPMTAMTAARLGLRDKAVDALLMPVQTNTYLPNGHNYQDGRLRIYLPGNGGLLSAIALMCAGWDGCKEKNPGIPKDWIVKWEGLKAFP